VLSFFLLLATRAEEMPILPGSAGGDKYADRDEERQQQAAELLVP
jgi:hypothetical protein